MNTLEVLDSILPKVMELIKQGIEKLEVKNEPTFYELEEETQALLPLIGNVVLQGLTDAQAKEHQKTVQRCECGNLQVYHISNRSLYLTCSVGDILLKKRAYYLCKACGRRSFPLDDQLALNSEGTMSRYLQEQVAWLFAQIPASRVKEGLPRFGWPEISETQIREKAKALGREIDETLTKKISEVEGVSAWPIPCVPIRLIPNPQTKRLYTGPDGWMFCTNERDPVTGKMQWREMKVAAVYEAIAKAISPVSNFPGARHRILDFVRKENKELEIATIDTATNITYVARTESWEEFGPYLLSELKQRGLDRKVNALLVVADGAPRIDGVVVDGQLRSDKHILLRILDIAHAQQHIWKVSNLAFGESTPLAKQWSALPLKALEQGEVKSLIEQFEELKRQCEDRPRVLEEIQRAINYFGSRAQQIDYPRFVAEGYQIGSGLAESACKRFGTDRMKGAGMRWSMSGVQATANLRMMLLSERWDEVSELCRGRQRA